jgi:lysophospholipase
LSGAAPLISTPEAPAPAGGEAAWIAGAGGVRLRAALFPAGGARGSVVLSPGRTEFIEKYGEVVGELRERGFCVLVHDWRGQGLSQRLLPDPLLGHAGGFAEFVEDHRRILDAYEARLPRPWIALGHSMGGALALLALSGGEDRFAAAALTAPMLGVRTGTAPAWLAGALSWAMGACGRSGLGVGPKGPGALAPFEGNWLTHDRGRYLRAQALVRACPELGLGPPTWGWLAFALAAGRALARPGALERIRVPVLLAAAGEEKLVLNGLIRRAARRLPRGRLIEVDGALHEILMETDARRARFWAAFDALAAGVSPPRG